MGRPRMGTVWLIAAGLVPVTAWGQTADRGSLFAKLHWVQLDVVRGRIVAVHPRLAGVRQHASEDSQTGVRESLSLNVSLADVSVHYQREDDRQRIVVDLRPRGEAELVCEPAPGGTGPVVRYVQTADQVALTVEQQGRAARYAARGLWALLLAHPEPCRDHLLPVLELLRPQWRLEEQAEDTRRRLLAEAGRYEGPPAEQVRALIRRLGADSFRERQAADRRLRSLGPMVLPLLDEIDPANADGEQRLRIRRIREALAPSGSDTPLRVAVRLRHDKQVWLALLDSPAEADRRKAAAELERLCGGPIAFDPAAPEAERRQQLAALRRRLRLDR